MMETEASFGGALTGNLIRNSEAISEIIGRACERHEMMILVTPYLRFETSFLRNDKTEVQVAATMSREDATYGLRSAGLRMRFPNGISFLEASTELKGFGMADGRRTLRLSIPEVLLEEDHRGAYRVDRVGRVPVTFSTPKYDLVTGTLVDISTTGARIYSSRDFGEGELLPGEDMAVTIQLTDLIRINTKVKLRHVHGRTRTWSASRGGVWRPRRLRMSRCPRRASPGDWCWCPGIRPWRQPSWTCSGASSRCGGCPRPCRP